MTSKGSLYRKCLNELTISRLCALSGCRSRGSEDVKGQSSLGSIELYIDPQTSVHKSGACMSI